MSEDSNFNRGQKKEEERSIVPDFSGSLGKGMLAKEKNETLGNSSGLTPLGFGVDIHNRIMDRENSELKRNGTNSDNVSSFGVRTSSLLNCSYKCAENTEMPCNSPGLSTLHPFDEIYSIKKKRNSLIEGFSNNEDLETLRNSSGLTPLNYDSEPPIKVHRVTPLEGVSAYDPQGIRVRGVENPQGFDNGKRRNSPQRTLRTQSPGLTNFAYNGE